MAARISVKVQIITEVAMETRIYDFPEYYDMPEVVHRLTMEAKKLSNGGLYNVIVKEWGLHNGGV